MEFFNKKQDVIDLQLTNYGRHLLSKGMFKPVYYSFYDDNIVYDIGPSGITETQNESEERIKQSQRLKTQYNYASLDREFKIAQNIAYNTNSRVDPLYNVQKAAEKKYVLPQPIGTMDLQAENAPSWTVRFLNGNLSGSQKDLRLKEEDGGEIVLNIPQLSTHISLETQVIELDQEELLEDLFDGPSQSNIIIDSTEEEYSVLLKVMENNSQFQKKNFDIEFFEIIEEKKENEVTVETLRPLFFEKPQHLMDHMDILDQTTPEDDNRYVDHYFDFKVDSEIPQTILCQYDPVPQKLGVFADERTLICQDVLNQQQRVSIDIYESGTDDTPGEIC